MKRRTNVIGTIALSELKGIGPAFLKKNVFNESFLSDDYLESIRRIIEFGNKQIDAETIYFEVDKAKEIVFKCSEENISIIDFNSQDYPTRLKELKDPPSILYCKGNLELLNERTIGIIGTREPTGSGEIIAERIGDFFSRSNWTICNGLAGGIDNFSIKSGSGYHEKILGVLAGGLNYNRVKTLHKKTSQVAEQVLENGGLIVSEYPPDRKEDTFSIVNSCRIQAGLSDAIILIQSSLSGGSKFAVKSFCQTLRPFGVISPIEKERNLSSYEANMEIIKNRIKGLAKFTGQKENRILTSEIFSIESKEDYLAFENLAKTYKTNKSFEGLSLFD